MRCVRCALLRAHVSLSTVSSIYIVLHLSDLCPPHTAHSCALVRVVVACVSVRLVTSRAVSSCLLEYSMDMATNNDAKLTVLDPTTVPESMEACGACGATDDAMSPSSWHVQWLPAAVLGASDGLVSTAAQMLGIGAARPADLRAVLLSGLAALIAGACSIAIGEYVSVHAQLDVELADEVHGGPLVRAGLSSLGQAAAASALSFAAGAAVPLIAAWFITSYKLRMAVVVATATVALAVFGSPRAVLGRAGLRAVVRGLVAMGITYGLMKLFRTHAV